MFLASPLNYYGIIWLILISLGVSIEFSHSILWKISDYSFIEQTIMRFSAKWLPQWYSGRGASGVTVPTGSELRRPAELDSCGLPLLSAPGQRLMEHSPAPWQGILT